MSIYRDFSALEILFYVFLCDFQRKSIYGKLFQGRIPIFEKLVSHREIFMHGYFESILTVVLKLFGYLAKVFF